MKSNKFRILCLLILAAFLTPLTLPAVAVSLPSSLVDIVLSDTSKASELLDLAKRYGETDLSELAERARQAGLPELANLAERLKRAGFTDVSSLTSVVGGGSSSRTAIESPSSSSGSYASSSSSSSSNILPYYTDNSSIQYKEAVDVISSIGVLGGYPEGDFRPRNGLTRGAAAKIVAKMIAPSDADSYPKTQRFSDVNEKHMYTYAGYVNYCYEQNLISGYSDGKFRPEASLTYAAFLKMLLCALGHNQNTEGYTDSGWQENVVEDARNAGLLTGLRSNFSVSDAISREVAALFALNLLQANKVDSSNGVAIPHATDSRSPVYKNIRDVSDDDGNQIVQFGEELFPELSRVSSSGKAIWTRKDASGNSVSIGPYDNVSELVSHTVRFNANYDNLGVISEKTKTVHNGCIYGELPALSRDGYAFLGWFTSSGGGDEITRHSPVWLSSDITLYAHWSKDTVILDANGGSPSETVRTVSPGGTYSAFPTPTRTGYIFDGWYTARDGGRKTNEGDTVPDTPPDRLYAHWTPRQYEVRFSASGSDVSKKTVTYGQTYGVLPEMPEKDGRPFVGWFTSDTGGQQITAATKVALTSNQTLYAQWGQSTVCNVAFRVNGERYGDSLSIQKGSQLTAQMLPVAPTKTGSTFYWRNASTGESLSLPLTVNSDLIFDGVFVDITYRVEYHAGGSMQDPDASEVSSGATLQRLPVLSDDAANRRKFKGWKLGNGAPVKAPLTVTENLDLYAQWIDVPSYSFANSAEGFGYGSDYFIPKERYRTMYGDNILAKALYEYEWTQSHGIWQGNCYGMITTIGMLLKSGNNILIANFRSSASSAWDLQLSDRNSVLNATLVEFIETMQIAQKTPSFVRAYWENINSYTGLCDAVSNFERTGENPVVICVWGIRDSFIQGHALLGYCLDDYSSSESRLYVYDPNHPGDTGRYIIMKKNSNGGYSGWEYNFEQNVPWGSSYPESILSYIPYDNYYASWNNRGRADNAMEHLSTTGIRNIAIYDQNDRQVASFTNGVLDDVETAVRNGVYPILPIGAGASANDGISVWVPAGSGYWIENHEANSTESVTLTNLDVSLTLNTSASEMYLSVDGEKVVVYPVDDPDASYDIRVNDEEDIPSEFTVERDASDWSWNPLWGQNVGSGFGGASPSQLEEAIQPTVGETTIDGESIPTVRGRTLGGKITIDLSTGSVQRDE